ncbi:transporter substrate-binding domain-containing protein [Thalassotalea sp. LPB0316]|uniref:substrate-binding periplasmic protein n=1 Tax=Thalassotalea sp. LPB0316 TaxID=2769490 RepID=UPI0018692E14|nr:transporter substrate-binding domain-containing protein [Thalassotalea sp. LPB0316]QOL25682.1 transporter substrate-binding domain-containing protein [Thalassotalea sp. LPB0316]
MKSYLLILLAILAFSAQATTQLKFVVNHPGSAPYLYYDKDSQAYKGVIPDILQPLSESNRLHVSYISNSRKRSEEYMYQGIADMIMLSEQWLSQPNKLIATIPLLEHRSFLYSAQPFPENFSLSQASKPENICTRKGFVYPTLQPYIDNKRLIRVDSSSQLTMLRMLFKKRCDYTIMNEFNADNLMNSAFFPDETLYASPEPITIVPLNIILRKELVEEKALLDAHIQQLKERGEIKRLIEKHMATKKGAN